VLCFCTACIGLGLHTVEDVSNDTVPECVQERA